MRSFAVNDLVIYHQPEASAHPAPGARDISPAERGELYTYVVDHFWRVECVNADGTIEAVGRSGRRHRLRQSDPALEKAGWWRRMLHRRLFAGL
jgi:hypothetical protein